MPALLQTKDSVYDDITQICKIVYQQNTGKRASQTAIKHLRSKAYEILLKKSQSHTYPDRPEINIELLKRCFVMKTDMSSVRQMERAESMEKCTETIMSEPVYRKEIYQNVLSFLICLTDNVEYQEPFDLDPFTFGKRDQLCLIKSKANTGHSSVYPLYPMDMFILHDGLDEEYYKDPIKRRQEAEARGQSVNPYFPNFSGAIFNLEPGQGLPLLGQFLPEFKSCKPDKDEFNFRSSGKFIKLDESLLTSCTMIEEKNSLRSNASSRLNSAANSSSMSATSAACPRVTFCPSSASARSSARGGRRNASSARSLRSNATTTTTDTSHSRGGVSIRTLTDQDDDYCDEDDPHHQDLTRRLELWSRLDVHSACSNHRNWSHLGSVNPPKEPPFATEADTALFLWSVSHPDTRINTLTVLEFLTDVRHMLVGIESRTFAYDERKESFVLSPAALAIPHRSPSAVEAYCRGFIEAGNGLKLLTGLFSEDNNNNNSNININCCVGQSQKGFIYDALRSKLYDEFLFTYRQIILTLPLDDLIGFQCRTSDLRKSIVHLAKIFKRYREDFPRGSRLLAVLLYEASLVVNQDLQLIMFAVIRACSTVYFRIIQQWLFTGTLCDPYGEMFIVRRPDVPGCTRLHWNTAYAIHEDDDQKGDHNNKDDHDGDGSVSGDSMTPAFLRDIVRDVLDCGKNLRLLKDCDPNHPLVTKLPQTAPDIPCCLSERSLRDLTRECDAYNARALRSCGELITVRSYLEREQSAKHDALAAAQRRRQENHELWKAADVERRDAARHEQDRQRAELRQQMAETNERRTQQRRERIRDEIVLIKRNETAVAEERRKIEEEKAKVRSYYDGLSRAADARAARLQWRNKRRRLEDKRVEFLHGEREKYLKLLMNPPTQQQIHDEIDDSTPSCAAAIKHNLTNINERSEPSAIQGDNAIHKSVCSNINEIKDVSMQQYDTDVIQDKLFENNTRIDDDAMMIERVEVMNEKMAADIRQELKLQFGEGLYSNTKQQLSTTSDSEPEFSSALATPVSDFPNTNIAQDENEEDLNKNVAMETNDNNTSEQPNDNLNVKNDNDRRASTTTTLVLNDNHNNLLDNFESARRNKSRVLGISESFDNIVNMNVAVTTVSSGSNMSQAQLNKQHVMGHHYNEPLLSPPKLSSYNANGDDETKTKTKTEAQLNKAKYLAREFGIGDDDDVTVTSRQQQGGGVASNTRSLTLNLNAEGLRNRERMFFSSIDHHYDEEISRDNRIGGDMMMKTSKSLTHMSVDSTPVTPGGGGGVMMLARELPDVGVAVTTADILEMVDGKMADERSDRTPGVVDLVDGFKFPANGEDHDEDIVKDTAANQRTTRHEENSPTAAYGFTSLTKSLDGLAKRLAAGKQLHIFHALDDDDQYGMIRGDQTDGSLRQLQLLQSDVAMKPRTNERSEDLNADEIRQLDYANLKSYLLNSVRAPLYAQFDVVRDAVMTHYLNELAILSHFRTLRRYILLLDGEYAAALCSKLFAKMEDGTKPQHTLSPTVLHGILAHALAVSAGATDPNTSRISFYLRDTPPDSWQHSKSDALGCLLPCYRAPWPLALVLTPAVLDQYGLVFQHLVKVRRVAHKLDECFETMNASLRTSGEQLLRSKQFRRAHLWRGAMSHFVRALQVYQTGSVLNATTWRFERLLKGVRSVDELYRRHKQYVKHITFLFLQTPSSHKVRMVFDNCLTSILLFNRTLLAGEWVACKKRHHHRSHLAQHQQKHGYGLSPSPGNMSLNSSLSPIAPAGSPGNNSSSGRLSPSKTKSSPGQRKHGGAGSGNTANPVNKSYSTPGNTSMLSNDSRSSRHDSLSEANDSSNESCHYYYTTEYRHPRYKDLEKIFDNFQDIAAHCFKFCLRLSTCGYQPMLVEFVDLLDANGYYTEMLKKYT